MSDTDTTTEATTVIMTGVEADVAETTTTEPEQGADDGEDEPDIFPREVVEQL